MNQDKSSRDPKMTGMIEDEIKRVIKVGEKHRESKWSHGSMENR
jgi:hypothetical protein